MHFSKSSTPLRALLISLAFLCSSCTETTSTQRDYVGAKEECQELASLKIQQLGSISAMDKDYQTALVAEFKDCMSKSGWSVTGPDKNKSKQDTTVTAAPVPVGVAPLAPPQDEQRLKRAAECAYARQAADNSSNARALARACELECKNMRSMQPEAPLPAACAP